MKKTKDSNRYLANSRGTKLHRQEFVETSSYINGVRELTKDGKRRGERVIRALDAEEKAWLANFNATYEHGVRTDDFLALSQEERSEIDHQDYARKLDLMYVTRKDGRLISYDLHELDKFTSEAEKDVDAEDLELELLLGEPVKEKRK